MPGNNLIIDDQLLHLIAKGDDKAFSKFYQLTSSQLYNAIMIYIKDQAVASEIMQVCYIKIWEHRQELQQVKCLKDYLFILARNAAFDHFKKVTIQIRLLSKMKHQMVELHDDVNSVIEEKEFDQIFHQVISRLPKQQRQVYMLAMEEHLSYDEIAEQMQVSKFTVKRHLELSRRFVRRYVRLYLQEPTLPIILLSTFYFL